MKLIVGFTLISAFGFTAGLTEPRSLRQPPASIASDFNRRHVLAGVLLNSLSTLAIMSPTNAAAKEAQDPKPVLTTTAKDIYGADLIASQYISSKKAGDRSMVQGLRGDPTFLLLSPSGGLEHFALNAECSHLGCVVPWSEFEKKFVCPCHGSQYDAAGMVLRGPAPYPLALARVDVDPENNKIVLSKWTEEDFRTNSKPWWT